jgi:hypothetical protein
VLRLAFSDSTLRISKQITHQISTSQPLKMELTEGSETSANYNLTPGKHPKEQIQITHTTYYSTVSDKRGTKVQKLLFVQTI